MNDTLHLTSFCVAVGRQSRALDFLLLDDLSLWLLTLQTARVGAEVQRRVAYCRHFNLESNTGEQMMRVGIALSPASNWPAILEAVQHVVVGVGSSRRLIRSAVTYADELNVYADEDVLRYAREQIAASGRTIELSVYRPFGPDQWPSDVRSELQRWEQLDVNRVFFNIGFDADLVQRVAELAAAL